MRVVLAVVDAEATVSRHTPAKNQGGILWIKADYDPFVNRIRGMSPAQSRRNALDSPNVQMGVVAGIVITWRYLHATFREELTCSGGPLLMVFDSRATTWRITQGMLPRASGWHNILQFCNPSHSGTR